jgi:hypothetical protein
LSADRGIFGLIRDVVRHAIAPLDFYATYHGRVVSQAADGTLEVEPDDGRLPGMTGLPIRHGIPGVSVKVAPETKVDITFENGDRRRPIVSGFEKDSLLEIVVTATTKVTVNCPTISLGEDGLPAARQGDTVESGGPGTIVTLMPILPIPAPPGAIAPMTPMQCYISFSAIPPTPVSADPLVGVIGIGSDTTTIQ